MPMKFGLLPQTNNKISSSYSEFVNNVNLEKTPVEKKTPVETIKSTNMVIYSARHNKTRVYLFTLIMTKILFSFFSNEDNCENR